MSPVAKASIVVIDNPPRRHEHTIEIAGSADLVVLTCVALFDIGDAELARLPTAERDRAVRRAGQCGPQA